MGNIIFRIDRFWDLKIAKQACTSACMAAKSPLKLLIFVGTSPFGYLGVVGNLTQLHPSPEAGYDRHGNSSYFMNTSRNGRISPSNNIFLLVVAYSFTQNTVLIALSS